MYTIKKSKTQWIIKFNKPVLNRLLNAHAWVYPVFWSNIKARLGFLGAPRILLDYDQEQIFADEFKLDPFGFTPIQTRVADFFIKGLNSTQCGDLKDSLEAIEDFAAKYLSK